ncbi:thiosulfate oxidation carrier protein SoxY [Castellaniella sp. FW104-16D08]|uniref:thiosulfate oxidation carrier protein SoxY n=1 Tax=unclassified Castellaniella TaxID=2617606 RepID=UPI003315111D
MNQQRRTVLKLGTILGLAVSAGILRPEEALAAQAQWNEKAFTATDIKGAVAGLGGDTASESDKINLEAPDIAENGAVVPIVISSDLPEVTQISILVPKNPNTLTASFDIPEGTLPYVSTRIKMGGTSDVYALVKSQGKFYTAHKEIKVTLGGCGG